VARLATKKQEISYIQICNQTSTSFYSNNGLKQVNVLATLLYNIAFDMIPQQAECNLIAVIFNRNHTALAYADSIGTLGQSKDTWKRHLIKLELNKKKCGLTANYEKTKIIKLMTQNLTLKINNHMFATVDKFKYLRSIVNIINNISNTIWLSILFTNKFYFSSSNALKSTDISRATSSKLYKAVTCPVVMYGAEYGLSAEKKKT
jgi:hypothetical protein